jgi:DNA-binding response OmpR family regulator
MAPLIMVVNDTQEILELFHEILSEAGYRVKLYSYNPTSLADVNQVQPDLIILDYVIGREEIGWQLLQKLRMSRATSSIPTIICTTATKTVQEIEGFLLAKQVWIVAKPFDVDDLLLAVRKALDPELQNDTSQSAPAEGA